MKEGEGGGGGGFFCDYHRYVCEACMRERGIFPGLMSLTLWK